VESTLNKEIVLRDQPIVTNESIFFKKKKHDKNKKKKKPEASKSPVQQ
jgi:hypothetical protein